ncbi:MAG: hypothetical protein CM15mP122_5470 [Bacteroidota bacterium]|nr:MAG: hypothetical protein CM15mP122_5470 [Bacteroidota bacterium]
MAYRSYSYFPSLKVFFLKGFNNIAGNDKLKQQLISFSSEKEIRKVGTQLNYLKD